MSALRQGVIVAREDGWACAWYEIATKGGGIYSKVEEDVAGQDRLEVGTKIWFGMEADAVGYFATTKPTQRELQTGVVKRSSMYGDERMVISVRTASAYHIARPLIAEVFGELGSRMSKEQRARLAKTIIGQTYQVRPWPRTPWFCDLIQRRIRPPRRKVPPRLKAVTSSEFVSEVAA